MNELETRLLRQLNAYGFFLVGQSDPDLKVCKALAKQGLMEKLDTGAATVAFFHTDAGRATVPSKRAAAPNGSGRE